MLVWRRQNRRVANASAGTGCSRNDDVLATCRSRTVARRCARSPQQTIAEASRPTARTSRAWSPAAAACTTARCSACCANARRSSAANWRSRVTSASIPMRRKRSLSRCSATKRYAGGRPTCRPPRAHRAPVILGAIAPYALDVAARKDARRSNGAARGMNPKASPSASMPAERQPSRRCRATATTSASARGAGANATTLGAEGAAVTIVAAVSELTKSPDALFVAAAGAGCARVREALRGARARFTGTRIAVEDDARVALRAAQSAGPGIVLIAGTGSVAYAENGERRVRVGGAGYLLGDEGSGFWIGLAAARLLARVTMGAPRTTKRPRWSRASCAHPTAMRCCRSFTRAHSMSRASPRSRRRSLHSPSTETGPRPKSCKAPRKNWATSLNAARRAGPGRRVADRSCSPAACCARIRCLAILLETASRTKFPALRSCALRDEPARAALRFAEALNAGTRRLTRLRRATEAVNPATRGTRHAGHVARIVALLARRTVPRRRGRRRRDR